MIRVHIWGSRGSITSPGASTTKYGGNTACIQVVGYDDAEPGGASDKKNPQVILDAGTGLTQLRSVLMAGPLGRGKGEAHIILSHFHWDHLVGLPFFTPIFFKGNHIHFHGQDETNVRASIERLFTSLYSPIKGTENLAATIEYHSLASNDSHVAGFSLRCTPTNHPGGALAIRLDYKDRSLVYATDHETGNPELDGNLVELARGTDLLILDAQYDRSEINDRTRWGHSSHIDAIRLALQAQVRKVVLFHHDPAHDDRLLDRMGLEAQAESQGSNTEAIVARDGMLIDL